MSSSRQLPDPLPKKAASTGDSSRAHLEVRSKDNGTVFAFTGNLTVHTLSGMESQLGKEVDKAAGAGGPVSFDLENLSLLDTSGALLLNRASKKLKDSGKEVSLRNLSEQQQQLVDKSKPAPEDENASQKVTPLVGFVIGVGKAVSEACSLIINLVGFFGQFLVTTVGILFRPTRMRWTSLIYHMEQVGLKAVPIVALLTFLIGLVVAYMGAQQLSMFGADIFAVNLLEVTVLREMAVLITAIVVAGRSSSSFTAQIGAMVSNEEVDAMRSMGLDPNTLLVVPRVLALIVCLPMLVFIADMMALLGGAVAIRVTIGINFNAFLTQLQEVASINNFFVGIVKTPFFAMAIGLVGCFQGFRATGSAESVGFLTTISVVQSIFVVILLDALFAIFFTTLGI